jgi:hypothetical protein
VQRQLLHQRIAQIGIVIHDQDLAGIGHGYSPLGAVGCKWKRLQPNLGSSSVGLPSLDL